MIKKNIEDSNLQEHLTSLPEDGREVFLLHNDQVRVTAISATTLINQMRANHDLGLLETYVLGQAYLAAGLLSGTVKGNDRIQLNIECGGPIAGVYVEAWAVGAVRGYLKHNPIPLTKPLKSLDLNELYGPGFLSVSKLLEGHKAPFTGQTMMAYGDLAKDLALYFQQSEQTPTLFSLSIHFNKEGQVTGSGALFIQAMPGCEERILAQLQEQAHTLPSIGEKLAEGMSIREYVEEQFGAYGLRHLARQPLGFSCTCSREQYKTYLKQLDKAEQQDILEHGPFPLELVCVNCNTHYHYEKYELDYLFSDAEGEPK
ncbi:MAG: molecular chaperone Hsp33 [Sphaerochaeta sp.]|jgi:molecular chaperone Hsp33|uniref:Hsp33 family molecular chaperone HslO n=1 Tax=Sphaerochaeta halotolerans TaxID=2293840 RepID=A0A372MHF1_9SPIR|nr:Hsp33 family molecular chaperone HslO [Sphaerochaeta halotolerans]MBG0767038.1 Hsp33 family molecular chaperone HslO [Spirochaetaceae bacterium]MDK2860161.1 molecular chaperone Hsp33 [Sphaerochaeta sp.]MDN5333681.1 molecular chaperone Hsp33 [Sphaerochaeta sp.]RFU94818.1 Hsp33 family molecular chaperone HslO [Sphaerochaeta halotolerans]